MAPDSQKSYVNETKIAEIGSNNPEERTQDAEFRALRYRDGLR